MKIRRVDFYPDDWLAGTAGMPGRDKSVYWDICALIYSRGGPIPDDEKWLSRVCGYHWREFRQIRSRLLDSGKIVSESGHVSVKRCSEELQRSVKRVSQSVQNGRKGGRKSYLNNKLDEPGGIGSEKAINQQPTLIIQQPTKDTRASRVSRLGRFEEWWSENPHKVGKGAARVAYARSLSKTTDEILIAGVRRYVSTKPPDRPWCNPATWLNQERWLDEETKPNGHDRTRVPLDSTPDPVAKESARLRIYAQLGIEC